MLQVLPLTRRPAGGGASSAAQCGGLRNRRTVPAPPPINPCTEYVLEHTITNCSTVPVLLVNLTRRRTGTGARCAKGCFGAQARTVFARVTAPPLTGRGPGPAITSVTIYSLRPTRNRTGAGAVSALCCTGKGHQEHKLAIVQMADNTKPAASRAMTFTGVVTTDIPGGVGCSRLTSSQMQRSSPSRPAIATDPGGRFPCAQGREQQLRREAGADALA